MSDISFLKKVLANTEKVLAKSSGVNFPFLLDQATRVRAEIDALKPIPKARQIKKTRKPKKRKK